MEQARSRPGGRSARVRADVLAATLDALAVVGYASLSLEDVATRAGVHKTTIYRHWPTKAELVTDALLDRSQQRIPVPDTGTLAGDLTALGRAVVRNLRSPDGRRTAKTLVAVAATSPEVAKQAATFWAERIQAARTIVERAQARREIAPDVDPTLVIETLLGPIWVRFLLTGEPLGDHLAADIARLIGTRLSTSDPLLCAKVTSDEKLCRPNETRSTEMATSSRRDRVIAECGDKSGSAEEYPFGDDVAVFKVGGRIFALVSLGAAPGNVSLKCDPDLAIELRTRYTAVTPGYHLNKTHWNTVELDGSVPDDELFELIDHSYELVVARLPRAQRNELQR